MSDIRQYLLTLVGVYIQDEDGQGWTLLTKDEEEAALIDESMHHLTNEEAAQFGYEINMERLHAAVGELREGLVEVIEALRQAFQNFAESVTPFIQETWELLRELADETEEEEPKKPQRPDYDARPKVCTRAKTKRQRKQRSRER